MGSIIPRKRKDGTVGYSAQIVIKKGGQIVHRETQTFDRRQPAVAWMRKREEALSQPGALERKAKVTLADVIDRYVDESLREIGRTKAQVLRSIKRYAIAKMDVAEIGSEHIVSFAQELAKTMQPQTVGNYLSHLAAIFAIAKPAWGYDLNRQAVQDAHAVLRRLGVTAKSQERDRRPTLAELDKLMAFFVERQGRAPESAPMHKIIAFAIFSTRRESEITRAKWEHLDAEGSRLLIEDMKHPGQKIGNDVWCDLPPEALAIALSMPKTADEIFPYTSDAIGAAFTRACYTLGINTPEMPDDERLHFHDLRHDGVSRLFEMGKDIPHVSPVSGHRSWTSLKRYTHLRQTGDKYKDWKWLSVVSA